MKTLYGKLKVPKLLRLPALIVLLLALSYTAWSQTSNSPVCYGQPILLNCSSGSTGIVCGDPTASYSWSHPSGWQSNDQSPVITIGQINPFPPFASSYQNGVYALTVRTGAPGSYTYTTGFVSVSFNYATVAPIYGPTSVCSGAACTTYSTTTGQLNYNWTASRSAGATPTISGTSTSSTVCINWGTATVTTYGYVNLTYIDVNGCTATATTYTVTINPLPVPTITANPAVASVCAGTTVTYTTELGKTAYSWLKYDGTPITGTIAGASNTSSLVVTWTNSSNTLSGTGSVTVFYTDANGCSATSATKTTIVNPTPATAAIAGNKTICTFGNYQYDATATGAASYNWTVVGPTSSSGFGHTSSIVVNWTQAGTGTITVTPLSASGCTGSVTTYTVTIAPVGTPAITGTAFACLPGAGTTTTTYSVTATGATTYAWSVAGAGGSFLGSSTAQTVTVIWSSLGTGTVTVIASSATCSNTASMATAVGVVPTPVVTGPTVVCNTTCANYSVAAPLGPLAGEMLYNWVVTASSSATITAGQGTQSITVCWGAAGTGTVQLYETLGSCSAISAVLTVTIGPSITGLDILTVTPPALTNVCQGTGGWNYYATAAGAPLETYEWAVTGPGVAPNASTITTGQSTYSITVFWGTPPPSPGTVNVVVGRMGCTATIQKFVNILAPPVIATPTASVSATCSGNSVTYTTSATGMCNYDWQWTIPGGSVTTWTYNGSSLNTSTSITLTYSSTATVTASVSLNYSNVCPYNGCNNGVAATKTVTIYPIPPVPTIVASPATAVCNGTSVVYTISNLPVLNGTSFTWTTTGSTATVGSSSGASTKTFTVTWTNTSGVSNQIGKVNLSFSSAGGCISTNTLSTTVYPTVTPVITGATSACVGETKVYTTETGKSNYNWTINNSAASITTGVNTATITVMFWITGQTDLTVTYTDANNCPSAVGTKSVIVHELPVPTITGPDQACEGTTVTYYTQSGNGENGWAWTLPLGGGTIVSGGSTATCVVNWTTNGARSVAVNYFNTFGCTAVAATVKAVTVGQLFVPSIAYTSTSLPVCNYSTGNTYWVSGGALPGWTYSWNLTGPNGSVITAGQNTFSVTVTWGGPGTTSGTIWVNAVNNNVTPPCVGTSQVLVVPILAPPSTPTITGTFSVCSGYPAVATTTGGYPSYTYATDGGMYNYVWEITSGAGLVYTWTGQGTNQITVRYGAGVAGGNVTWKVTYSNDPANNCKNNYSRTVTVLPNEMPTIVATPSNVCAGSSQLFTTEAPNLSGYPNGYSWTVTGITGTSSSGSNYTRTANWAASTTPYTGTVSVYYTGYNGCRSQVKTITVTVNGQPTTPVISGPATVCANVAGQTTLTSVYTVAAVGANAQYNWTVGGNVTTFTGQGTRTITVTWGAAGTGNIVVSATIIGTGGNCVAISSAYIVTINPTDVPSIVSISDPFDIVCQNTGGHIYQTISGMSQYTWEATGPGVTTTTAGQFSNPVTVFWGGPGLAYGNLRVSVVNSYGCRAISAVKTVTISAAQPTLTGEFVFCGYPNTWHTYTAGASTIGDYNWEIYGNVVTYTTLIGSQTLNVMFAENTSGSPDYNNWVKVTYTGDCSSAQSLTKTITVLPIPQPAIQGTNWEVCQNACDNGQNYNVYWTEANPGSTYEWSVSGGIIQQGQNSNIVWVCWTTCPEGTLQVTETNSYGCTVTSDVATVNILPKPAPVISGALTVYANTNEVYTTPAHGNNLYTWTVVGGTITGGQGTNQITVAWGPIPSCWCGIVTVCESTIGQNNQVLCTGCTTVGIDLVPAGYTISGYVSYKNGYQTKLNNVEVYLRNVATGSIVAQTTTGPNLTGSNPTGAPGFFAFVNIPDGNYEISAESMSTWGGNNATDALLVQLHILGTPALTGLNLTVADVNASTTITSLDALNIKLRTVGMVNYYAAGDWKFDVTPVTIALGVPQVKSFNGLCVGDVNGSFIPSGMKSASLLASIDDGVQTVPVNTSFAYDLRSNELANLGAMTLFMTYDESKFEIEKVSTVLEGMKYSINNGQIALAWSDTRTLDVSNNDVVISLQMKAKSPITEATQVFELQAGSEFADALAQPFENFGLKMSKVVTTGNAAFSIQNYPNPFKNSTDIVYTLPETGTVKLIVTDMLGKTVSTLVNGEVQNAGTYRITVNAADGKMMPGVYLYRIDVEGANASFVKTNKMTLTR